MASLAHCIELADLHPIEVEKLTAAAAAYRKEGFKAKEANTGAVKDFIKGLESERTDVVKQVKKLKPELFKPVAKVRAAEEKPAKGRGQRSNKEGVEFYNPFRPKTRSKVIEGKKGYSTFRGKHQAYRDGFFTQGHYAVKIPKEPEVKKDIITGKDAPDIKATFPNEKDLAPAYILGEYKPNRAGCTFVHAMTAGQQDTFFNADYVDVILTKYPDAKLRTTPFEYGGAYGVFDVDGEVVGLVMSTQLDVSEALEEIKRIKGEQTKAEAPEIKPAKEPAKKDILFAERGGVADARHTVESLKTELSERIGKDALEALVKTKKVNFIMNDEAAILTGRPDIIKRGGVQGFYFNGIVYLLPENINVSRGWNVLIHELGVHHGYNKIFGEKLAREVFSAFVANKNKATPLGRAVDKATGRVERAPVRPGHENEEAVAYFCEEHANIDLALHRKIIARMRLWAVKYFGVKPDIFTHDDYVALAASAMRQEGREALKIPTEGRKSREVFFSTPAWHGGPHAFEKFKTEEIGTGEGAQAFGWGLYFTDLKDIAKTYAEATDESGRNLYKVTLHKGKKPSEYEWLEWDEATKESQIRKIEAQAKKEKLNIGSKLAHERHKNIIKKYGTLNLLLREVAEKNKEAIKDRAKINAIRTQEGLYKNLRLESELKIKPNMKSKYATPEVIAATKNVGYAKGELTLLVENDGAAYRSIMNKFPEMAEDELWAERVVADVFGTDTRSRPTDSKSLYANLSEVVGSDKEASLFLLRAGIDGVKYPAGTLSGTEEEGVSNYVVFDESAVTIEEHIRYSEKEKKDLRALADERYPIAKEEVDGRVVLEDIPNTSSIEATLDDWVELPGIREISMSELEVTDPKDLFYAADDMRSVDRLAEKIKESNEISPLIVVQDAKGLYVLEGGHRLGALHRLKAKSFPALVVIEKEADIRYSIEKFSVPEMPVEEAEKEITDNPNFVKWFGDSKVVGGRGKPLPVYHWTPYDFNAFDMEGKEGAHFGTKQAAFDIAKGTEVIDYEIEYDGTDKQYFVYADQGPLEGEGQGPFDTKKEAKAFISQQPKEIEPIIVYLKLENPIKMPDLGIWTPMEMMDHAPEGLLTDKEKNNVMEADDRYAAMRNLFLLRGVDGIYYTNTEEDPGSTSYIVFEPTQIKSIFNIGTFDPTKADIRYSAKEKKDLHTWADNLIKSAKDHGVVLDKEPPSPERLRETSVSILSGLDASKLGGSARSFLEGLDPKGKGYGAAIEKWLASPEWYQHPVLKKIVGRSLDKSEKFHNTFNEFNAVDDPMAEHDTVAKTLEALARKGGISKAASILGRTSSDFKKLETLLDDADVYGEKHTVESLKKDGYSPDVIQAWSVVRESYDKQLDALIKPMKDLVARIKEQAAFMGTEPVYPEFGDFIIEGKKRRLTLQEAVMEMGRYRGTYSPRIRERGAWVVSGKIEKSIAEGGTEYFRNNRKSKSFANLLRDDLKRQGYTDIKVEKEDRLPEETFQAIRMAEMGTMIGHAASKGLDKYDGEMQMAFMDEIVTASADMIKSRGARATMIRRREGMAVKGYVTDPLIRFVRYTGTNAAGIAKAEMAEKMIKDLYGVYVDGKKTGGIDATKEGEVHSMARAYIEEQLRNTEAGDRAVGILKGLTTLKFLGFNPRSILVNLSSLTTSVPMSLHTYAMDGKGSLLRIGKFLSIGCKDYTKIMAGKQLPNTDEATFIDNFRNSGYTDAQYTRDATGMVQGAYGTAWSKLMGGSMWAFGKSEEWVRGGTALTAYRLCKKQGLSHTQAEKKAINATAKAHGTYGKETLPMVAWGKGVGRLGQAFYTYLKFPHNYMQMLYDAGIRKKNIKGVIFGMAAPAVLGGIVAVPMFSATMAIANAMLSLIDDDRDAEKFVYDTLNEYLGETGEEAVRGGLLGLLDVDISGSLSMGPGAIPTSLFELTGAVGGMVQDIYRGGKFAIEGEYGRAFEKLVPKAVGNIALAIREIREGATTGRGDRVWDEEGRPYMPTPSETAKRALGFRSARRALLAQSTWVTKREERRFKETRSDIYRKIKYLTADAESVRIDKETSDKISRYNKNALKTSNVTLISPASVEYQIAKMDTPTSKQKARVTQSERAATFEGDIWADALGVTDEPDTAQAEVKRLSDLGILKYSAPPSRNINAGHDIKVKLDDDQYSRYVADTSAIIKLAMDRLVARSAWQKWSDKKRAFAIKRVINKGRKIVRDRLKKTILKARLKRR